MPGPYGPPLLFSTVARDGLNWRREPGVRLVGENGKPVHAQYPSIVRTPDGRLRMYYDSGGIRSAVTAGHNQQVFKPQMDTDSH